MTNVTEFPVDAQGTVPAVAAATHPLFWSVRRELWENRSLYIAPAIAAAVFLAGFALSTVTLPHRIRTLAMDPSKQQSLTGPYGAVAGLLIVTAFLVGVFYCLDALHGERRDRSILFWKSLPVSDLTTVLSKASIPLVVLPALVFALAMTVQLLMLLLSSAILLGTGSDVTALWARLPLPEMSLGLLYGLLAIALWHAPVYAWLLLVSGWAKRAVFLWAVMPFLAVGAFEKVAFNTKYVMAFLGNRMTGWFYSGFKFVPSGPDATGPLGRLTPVRFFSTPGLWIGLAFAVVFLALAVRMRRNREAI